MILSPFDNLPQELTVQILSHTGDSFKNTARVSRQFLKLSRESNLSQALANTGNGPFPRWWVPQMINSLQKINQMDELATDLTLNMDPEYNRLVTDIIEDSDDFRLSPLYHCLRGPRLVNKITTHHNISLPNTRLSCSTLSRSMIRDPILVFIVLLIILVGIGHTIAVANNYHIQVDEVNKSPLTNQLVLSKISTFDTKIDFVHYQGKYQYNANDLPELAKKLSQSITDYGITSKSSYRNEYQMNIDQVVVEVNNSQTFPLEANHVFNSTNVYLSILIDKKETWQATLQVNTYNLYKVIDLVNFQLWQFMFWIVSMWVMSILIILAIIICGYKRN